MKRILATLMTLLLIFSMTSALAFSWGEIEPEECTEYILTVTKYEKVGDVGEAFKVAPNKTAKIGDTVYFNITSTDVEGEEIECDIELHHLSSLEAVGDIYRATVVGSNPYIKVSITEKTPVQELTYEGKYIVTTPDTVNIGELTFIRNAEGKVIEVTSSLNTAEMLKELAELGIAIDDIYNGSVCMTDDNLIANFGVICNTSAAAKWYVPVEENIVTELPKTGDMSTAAGAIGLIVFVALGCYLGGNAKHWKR